MKTYIYENAQWCYISPPRWGTNSQPIAMNFGTLIHLVYLINLVKFGIDRLQGRVWCAFKSQRFTFTLEVVLNSALGIRRVTSCVLLFIQSLPLVIRYEPNIQPTLLSVHHQWYQDLFLRLFQCDTCTTDDRRNLTVLAKTTPVHQNTIANHTRSQRRRTTNTTNVIHTSYRKKLTGDAACNYDVIKGIGQRRAACGHLLHQASTLIGITSLLVIHRRKYGYGQQAANTRIATDNCI